MSHLHLSSRVRYVIEHLVRYGLSYREIGRRLERSHTTIAREVHRNGQNLHGLRYGPLYLGRAAGERALARRCWLRRHRKRDHAQLWSYVLSGLAHAWSPEQIAGRLVRDYPRSRFMRVAPESIYRWLYADAAAGGELYKALRRCHRKRRKQGRYGSGRGLIPGRVGIAERPVVVEGRGRFGDWEGDLVEGGKGTGGLATLVERRSRYLLAGKVVSKHAGPTARVITDQLRRMPPTWRQTLTLDNGKEFASFKDIEDGSGIVVYFADPYSAWQRGCNENTNGLIRQFLPKGIDMREVSPTQLAKVVENINHRPRKCLGFKTPHEVFSDANRGAFDM